MDDASSRVPLTDVTHLMVVGEALPFRVFDSLGRLLLNEGQRVLGPAQFDALVARGAWVERSAVAQLRQAASAAAARRLSLFDLWEQATWDLDSLLRAVAASRAAAADLEAWLDRCVALIDRDPDVALFAAHRQQDRRFALYPTTHAIHSSTVALLAARQAGWDAARQRSLLGAALTMNLSMVDLQAQMAEQKDPPSRRQMERIRGHPEASVAALRGIGVHDETWLETVLQHHEVPGGGGYPRSIQTVIEPARLLRHADVYMAKITPRALRAALSPRQATAQLVQQSGGDALAVALIRSIGVHPPGTLVRLASGEVAVVVRRGAQGTAPLVGTLSDRQGRPIATTASRQTQDQAFAVTPHPVDAAAFPRVQPERVYGWIAA